MFNSRISWITRTDLNPVSENRKMSSTPQLFEAMSVKQSVGVGAGGGFVCSPPGFFSRFIYLCRFISFFHIQTRSRPPPTRISQTQPPLDNRGRCVLVLG